MENILFALPLLAEHCADATSIAVVTDAFHVPRARALCSLLLPPRFRRVQFVSADVGALGNLPNYGRWCVREVFAWLKNLPLMLLLLWT